MQPKGPSRTAIGTAIHRAAHVLLDAEPKILADTFARAFTGHNSDADLLRALESMTLVDFLRMRTVFALRNRYAEDELARAVNQGIAQYIMLGAGLDSFAYRHPDLMGSLDVFEVDHPATQNWKRARVTELGVTSTAQIRHISIDFERNGLARRLSAGGVDQNRPIFLSWLGVTQYLTRDAVLHTLREIAAIAVAGSELVIQFIVSPATLAPDEAGLVTALATRVAAIGEPWRTYFEPMELERHLREAGFGAVRHLDAGQATARYLQGRTDGLRLTAYFHMVTACEE